MERLSKLVRSLRTARASDLPEDPTDASYVLMPMVMQNQHKAVAELLSNSRFDISHKFGKAKRSLLHIAANVGALESLIIFVKRGAEVDSQDRSGITPLQLAARNGHARCIQKLIEVGADLDLQNNEGMTPLHWLASNGRTEILEELLPYVKRINITDHQGQTALHVACLNGHHQTIRTLLQNKSIVNVTDVNGYTPLFSACRHGHSLPVKLLLENGARLISDNDGISPLEVAFKNGYGDVCLSLLEYEPVLITDMIEYALKTPKDQALRVYFFLCHNCLNIQKDILNHLAKQIFSLGTLLLNTTEECDSNTNDDFLLLIEIMCSLWIHESEDRSLRLRSTSNSSIRSRIDSGGRFLRNLGSPPPSSRRKEDAIPAFDDISDTLNALWISVDNWFKLFQNEIKMNKSNSSTCSHNTNESNSIRDFVNIICPSHDSFDCPSLKSWTSRRLDVVESVRLSQPALEFNLSRLIQDGNPRLSRSLSGTGSVGSNTSETTTAHLNRTDLTSVHNASVHNASVHDTQRRTERLGSHGSQNHISFDHRQEQQEQRRNNVIGLNHRTDSHDGGGTSRHRNQGEEAKSTNEENPDGIDAVVNRICSVVHGFNIASLSKPFWSDSTNEEIFDGFVSTKEDVLRLIVARKPDVIFRHFHFLLRHPLLFQNYSDIIQDQPFELRRQWFYDNLFKHYPIDESGFDERNLIAVDRGSVLESSCEQVLRHETLQLRRPINIQFKDEQGMGQGVAREWLDILFKELLNPDCALFTLSADGTSFQPNKNSFVNPDHLTYFNFAGRMLGMALYHQYLVNANFTRSFYKHLLGVPVNYADVSSIDLEYSKNLQWILDNNIDDLGLDLSFSIETDVFGESKEVDLKPEGSSIVVTDANKVEYVQLASDLRMTKAIKPQLYSILEGFHEFIPHSLVAMFNECELETMLSGLSTIDVTDWQKHATYHSGFSEESQVIQWFWDVVHSFDEDQCILLLRFVTGSSHVPWGGFANLRGSSGLQPFSISRSSQSEENLPTASTCFNMLQLPEYSTKEILLTKVTTAIGHGTEGFEFT